MSEILVNTIKKADGTGSITVPANTGTLVDTSGADFTGDVTTTGNVGIGTSSPSVAIHIADTEAETGIQLGTGADLTIKRDVSESAGIINAGSDLNNLRFSTGGTERMRINSAGDVEIYDAVGQSDGAALHIRKNSDAEYLLHLQSNTGSSANQRGLKITSDTPNLSSPLILVENSGGEIFKVQNDGTMSKSSGSFKINHPLESKRDTHFLVHSFVEAPQADNIYRGKVDLVAGSATVNIDTVAGMTEGTFAALNREVQCFTSNESGWTAVKGSVSGNILTI